MQARERAAGRSDEIVRFKTVAEAQAAAEAEGRRLAGVDSDISFSYSSDFDFYNDPEENYF